MKDLPPSEIIARLGGQKAVTELTGLKQPTISGWSTTGRIPKGWMRYFQATRPDVFKPAKRAGAKR